MDCFWGKVFFAWFFFTLVVQCYVDDALEASLTAAMAQLDGFLAVLALQDCETSARLGFGAWLARVQSFCSGASCPALPSPNLYAFLQANRAFNALAASIAPMRGVGAD